MANTPAAASRLATGLGSPSIEVASDASTAAAVGAWHLARHINAALALRGRAQVAMSGGSATSLIVEHLLGAVPSSRWSSVTVVQVDERVVPDEHPDRNALLLRPLQDAGARLLPMPVTEPDLETAAGAYAALLAGGEPSANTAPALGTAIADAPPLDVVHLGVGSDGHTASWPPAPHRDSDLWSESVAVGLVEDFNQHDRMTLTAAVVNNARARVVVAAGESKAPVIAKLVAAWHDQTHPLPAAHVTPSATTLVVDAAAAAQLS